MSTTFVHNFCSQIETYQVETAKVMLGQVELSWDISSQVGTQILFYPNFFFTQSFSWTQNCLDMNFFWTQNLFGLEIFLDQTFFCTQHFFAPKLFFNTKFFGTQKFFGPDIFLGPKLLWRQNVLDPKDLGPKTCFNPKLCRPNIFRQHAASIYGFVR